MRSRSATSQWGRRSQVPAAGSASAPTSPEFGTTRGSSSPQVRTVTLASASPTGTSGSAGFGMRRSASSSSASTRPISASRAAIRSPAATEAARRAATSGPLGAAPALMASPICFETPLRSALRESASPRSARRRASSASAASTMRGVLALVEGPFADRVRLVPEALDSDAHLAASRVSSAPVGPDASSAWSRQPAAARRRSTTKPGSRLARSQPARGPLVRPRNAT